MHAMHIPPGGMTVNLQPSCAIPPWGIYGERHYT
jgi:hypothetical protein